MKAKLPPLVYDPRHPVKPGPSAHRSAAEQAHAAAKNKAADRAHHKNHEPKSTDESRSAGEAFREALFGPSAMEQETARAMSGGFGEGGSGGQSKGQGGQHKDEKSERRSARLSAKGAAAQAASAAMESAKAASEMGQATTEGWMELEIESRVAGRIRLWVRKEEGLLRARLNVGNALAAQWMQEHLPSVEQQLADELGCRVKLEMKG